MKAIFIVNYELGKSDGITSKVVTQQRALNEILNKCYLSYVNTSGKENGRYVGEVKISTYSDKYRKINLLLTYFDFYKIYRFIISNDIQYVYIRYSQFATPFFNFFLKKLKQSGCTICLEIPTYPYDEEQISKKNGFSISRLAQIILKKIEVCSRTRFQNSVDRIITFTAEKEIFGVKTISIDNACSSNLEMVKKNDGRKILRLVGVASLNFWHGYDRLLNSLYEYYLSPGNEKPIVEFHIIGDGKEKCNLVNLTKILELEDYVYFHGHLTGGDLDRIMSDCDIGIDALGRHRSGNETNNSLKSKEYMMRGLPIIKSHIDPSLEKTIFHYTVSSDDKDFNLDNVVKWYRERKFSNHDIHCYAIENFTWEKQMQKVLKESGVIT
ncbi:hypothetical protein AB6C64_13740 [Vibrio cyclitrophicus]